MLPVILPGDGAVYWLGVVGASLGSLGMSALVPWWRRRRLR